MCTDKLDGLKGTLRYRVYRNDEIVEDILCQNLIVSSGRNAAMALLGAGTSGKVITQFAVGTNAATAAPTDTALTDVFAKSVGGVSYPSGAVQFAFSLELAESNGITINEFGLMTADGTLFARKVVAPIIKDNTVRFEGDWTIQS